MNTQELDNRLTDIEINLTHQQKVIDELNDMLIKQGKLIDLLLKQNEWLKSQLTQDVVKPLEEETPPPHY